MRNGPENVPRAPIIGREAEPGAFGPGRSVANWEDQMIGRLASLDAEAKDSQVRVKELEALLAERDVDMTGMRIHAAELEARLSALDGSRAVRIALILQRTLWPLVAPLLGALSSVGHVRHRRPGSARRMREAYERHTAQDQALETIRSNRELPPVFDSGYAVTETYGVLRDCRETGALVLDAGETDLIESTLARRRQHDPGDVRAGDELLAFAAVLARAPRDRDPLPRSIATGRNLVVVDGRVLQSESWADNGRRARPILREIVGLLPDGVGVCVLPSHHLGPIDPGVMEIATEVWNPMKVNRVVAYLQLDPFIEPHDEGDTGLLLDRSIRKVAVFPGGVKAEHPRYYIRNEWEFWLHQLGVERLRLADTVLVHSQTGANQVRAMLRGDHSSPDIVIVGDPVSAMELSPPPAPVVALGRYVAVVASPHFHGNLAAAVAGLSRICGASNAPALVIVSNADPSMVSELRAMAIDLGIRPSKVFVTGPIRDDEATAVIRDSLVAVIPTFCEDVPSVVPGAIESGTPVVASRIADHLDTLGDGPWMFDPADPADLARSVGHVLDHAERVLAVQRAALAKRPPRETFGRSIARALVPMGSTIAGHHGDVRGGDSVDGAVRTRVVDRSELNLCKVCEVEDFANPELREVMRDVFSHEVVRFGETFPDGREQRKYWEISMAVLAFRRTGLMGRNSTILGIGAGNEATCFYLTRHVGRVLATDLYESPGWEESASMSMITNPGWHWPFPWEAERLQVRHMDALNLELDDCSVDGIFSSSSVEHFGSHDAVRRSLDEAHRVLRPGGVLSVSTEFRLMGPPPGLPGVLMFDRSDVDSLFIGGRTWELLDPFDHQVSPRTIDTMSSFSEQVENQFAMMRRFGGLFTHITTYSQYPNVALHVGTRMFTSMHIALRKTS